MFWYHSPWRASEFHQIRLFPEKAKQVRQHGWLNITPNTQEVVNELPSYTRTHWQMESVGILVPEAMIFSWDREMHSILGQRSVDWVESESCLTSLAPCRQRCIYDVKNLRDPGISALERILNFILTKTFVLLMNKMNLREVECSTRSPSELTMMASGLLTARLCIIPCFRRRRSGLLQMVFCVCCLQFQKILFLKFMWWPTFTRFVSALVTSGTRCHKLFFSIFFMPHQWQWKDHWVPLSYCKLTPFTRSHSKAGGVGHGSETHCWLPCTSFQVSFYLSHLDVWMPLWLRMWLLENDEGMIHLPFVPMAWWTWANLHVRFSFYCHLLEPPHMHLPQTSALGVDLQWASFPSLTWRSQGN